MKKRMPFLISFYLKIKTPLLIFILIIFFGSSTRAQGIELYNKKEDVWKLDTKVVQEFVYDREKRKSLERDNSFLMNRIAKQDIEIAIYKKSEITNLNIHNSYKKTLLFFNNSLALADLKFDKCMELSKKREENINKLILENTKLKMLNTYFKVGGGVTAATLLAIIIQNLISK